MRYAVNMLKIIRFIPLILLLASCSIPESSISDSELLEIVENERRLSRYEALTNLGKKHYRIDPNRSIEFYNKAIQIYPNHPTAYYGRGDARSELEQYKLAISDYDKSIECDWSYNILRYKYLVYCARAKARMHLLPNIDKNSDTYIQMFSGIFIDLKLAEDNAIIFKDPGAMEIIEGLRSLLDDIK